jgi:FMN-dependent NADH-azoreductase
MFLTRNISIRIFLFMTNLLHIDSSINGEQSHSREVTAAFAEAWRVAHPGGGYTYRDLAAQPVPHITGAYVSAGMTPVDQWTPEQREAWDFWTPMHDELRAAHVILLGVPMYNFTLPSTLKAWADHVTIPEFMVDRETGDGVLVGKKVIAVTARGGSYGPGTPREDWDFQAPLLRAMLSYVGLDRELTFVHTEMTLAYVMAHLEQFRDIADQSKQDAHKLVLDLAAAA